MFRGVTNAHLDDKGRLTLPTRYRTEFTQQNLIITIDIAEKCLLLYPLVEWEKIEVQLEAMPNFNHVARSVQRLLIGHATEVVLDNQARILLPQPLRQYAKLEKQVVILGQGRKLELWDETVWQEQRDMWLDSETINTALSSELRNLSL